MLVEHVLEDLRQAFMPDYIVLGGGNVKHLRRLPARVRRGRNADAFAGGFRLWDGTTKKTPQAAPKRAKKKTPTR